MKSGLISVLILLMYCKFGFGQINHSAYTETGLNRIGFSNEIGYGFSRNRLQINVGVKLYYPNIVFQKNRPGLSFGLLYTIKSFESSNLFMVTEASIFNQSLNTHALNLFDPLMFIGMNWELGKAFGFNAKAGVGGVFNSLKAITQAYESKSYNYINYEISVGFNYRFNAVK